MKNSLLLFFTMLLSSPVVRGRVACNEDSSYAKVTINGNIRVVLDEKGKTIQRTESNATPVYPFGLAVPLTPSTSDSTRLANKYLFLDRELQPETGNYDLIHRQYDPTKARFDSQDPITDTQEHLSLYQYGWNNPVNKADPDGQFPHILAGALIGGAIGGAIEAGTQFYQHGKINDWSAVGGATVQGSVTGAAAAATGGLSLLTVGVAAGANAVGGAASNAIQGKEVTVGSVAKDAAIGAGSAVGGALVGKALSSAKGAVTEMVTVHRGVNSTSPAFAAAENGVVKPRGGVFGHSNTTTHNSGVNGTANSKMTSWTTNPEVAKNFALRTSGNGVVLTQQVSKSSIIASPNAKIIQLIQGGGRVSESEVLLRGIQRNVTVQKIGQ